MSIALPMDAKPENYRGVATAQLGAARGWLIFAAIALFTLILRLPEMGNPAPDFDEQLYFLTGDRMWSGALPFVDIWDRKPIGLFLIYAAIRGLGGDGIIQYQLVAAGFAAATAWLVYCITLRFSSWKGALCAALVYVLYLRGLNSTTGQTETFLMLFTVVTMLLAIRSLETENDRHILKLALASMLIMGAALQVKYTVLPQCVFFGLFFLWRIRSRKTYLSALKSYALPFVALGLLPTALVAAFYGWIGHFDDFYYANFTSIFDRGKLTGKVLRYCITYSSIVLAPLVVLAIGSWIESRQKSPQSTALVAIGLWFLFCFVGIVMTGSIYVHYCVPVVPALAILLGAFVDRSPIRYAAPIALLLYVFMLTGYSRAFAKNDGDIAAMAEMTAIMKPHVGNACIYVYDGPSALYTTTNSCLPTRRPYPDHLNNLQEKYAMGMDQATEVARVLSNRPVAIVTAYPRVVPHLSRAPKALVYAEIDKNYQLVTRQKYDRRHIFVYLRKDLAADASTTLTTRTR